MPHHQEKRFFPHSAEHMFDLVADVKRYPEFLPWIVAARVRTNSDDEMLADLVVGFKAIRQSFTSRVHKVRPVSLTVDYLDGPMSHLNNCWRFIPVQGGCIVDFTVDFAFSSRMFEAIAGQVFDTALRRMTSAFEARANALYGPTGAAVEGNNSSSATSAA